MSYCPGDEIKLNVDSKTAFYSKALTWKEQKDFIAKSDTIKKLENEQEQTEAGLALACEYIERTEPAVDITPDGLSGVLDYRQIWGLVVAIQYNMTADEKKT